jgi:glutamate-1-semialdehyde 2,1-aminomutase
MAMAAGLETLKILKAAKPYKKLEKTTAALCGGLRDAAERAGVPVTIAQAGSMFTVFFAEGGIKNADDARRCDTLRFAKFFRAMLEKGIYLAPSQFEACFLSTDHGEKEIGKTLDAARKTFQEFC